MKLISWLVLLSLIILVKEEKLENNDRKIKGDFRKRSSIWYQSSSPIDPGNKEVTFKIGQCYHITNINKSDTLVIIRNN